MKIRRIFFKSLVIYNMDKMPNKYKIIDFLKIFKFLSHFIIFLMNLEKVRIKMKANHQNKFILMIQLNKMIKENNLKAICLIYINIKITMIIMEMNIMLMTNFKCDKEFNVNGPLFKY